MKREELGKRNPWRRKARERHFGIPEFDISRIL
jgi:hypothetical protein